MNGTARARRDDRSKQRRYRRRTVRVLVDYLCSAGLCCDTATTLGAGGLFIETETPLPPGTRLKLAFQLPDGGVRHEIEGEVVWSRRPADAVAGGAGMGIEFSDRVGRARLARELQRLDA